MMNIHNIYNIIRTDYLVIFILSILSLAANADISDTRKVEIINLLKQDCGSCHGMTLKGGLGPALTPARLKTKSKQMLVETILHGRPGTPMPPWAPFLNREEVLWLVEQLYQDSDYVE